MVARAEGTVVHMIVRRPVTSALGLFLALLLTGCGAGGGTGEGAPVANAPKSELEFQKQMQAERAAQQAALKSKGVPKKAAK
jgi:hypothetical protein